MEKSHQLVEGQIKNILNVVTTCVERLLASPIKFSTLDNSNEMKIDDYDLLIIEKTYI